MSVSTSAFDGIVVTPHHLATQSAVKILKDGGTAMEAVVAAAATVAVVYPHMNGIGGDGFWLIVPPHDEPFVIEASGPAGSLATPEFFKDYEKIPSSGPKSAITVAGTVGGWEEALNYVSECGYQRISVSRLLGDAIKYAEEGFPVTTSHERYLRYFIENKQIDSKDFVRVFLPGGELPKVGQKFCQKDLAKSLKHLVEDGLDSFYRGNLAKSIAEDMALVGLPITEKDLNEYAAVRKTPLRLLHSKGELFNTPPPTQGMSSLQILGILDKLKISGKHEGEFVHATIEATKQAFNLRNEHLTDPREMKTPPQHLLTDRVVTDLSEKVNLDKASPYSVGKGPGDTIWLGVMDNKGFSVSFIQSLYQAFGSKVILPKTGIVWQNRGISFSLNKNDKLYLKPGKKPIHTLNPAAARLNDGRVLVYGTRGGDGQPQTQAAIFHRYVIQNVELQESVSAPRWVYGRTTDDHEDKVKIEGRFSKKTIEYLKNKGHDIVMLPNVCDVVGQAGVLVRHSDGLLEGAFDHRGNGSVAGF